MQSDGFFWGDVVVQFLGEPLAVYFVGKGVVLAFPFGTGSLEIFLNFLKGEGYGRNCLLVSVTRVVAPSTFLAQTAELVRPPHGFPTIFALEDHIDDVMGVGTAFPPDLAYSHAHYS